VDLGVLPSQVLATQSANLLGYYQCNDESGGLVDSGPKGNDLAEQGSGHTYGIEGRVGTAVSGNGTGGWNNGGTVDTGVDFLPGENGFTMMALIGSDGTNGNLFRLFGWGSSTSNVQCYDREWNTSGARTLTSVGNEITTLGNITHAATNILDDTLDFYLVGLRSDLGEGTTGDDAISRIDDGVVTQVKTDLTFTTSDPDHLDLNCVNSFVHTGADTGQYGTWYIQHVMLWNTELTDTEILDIAVAAGVA
jgi:hypothetical protein